MNTNRRVMRVLLFLLLLWAAVFVALACAHAPDTPPGDACPAYAPGWIEYRPADCTYWRCEAATRRRTYVDREEPCTW